MVFRRHKRTLQAVFGFIIIVIAVKYCYEYYQETSTKLKAANVRHHELLEDRNRFSREVEVLTKSKTDLEYALRLKSGELSKFSSDCQTSKNQLENQINRDKSESMARFNALDSEHRMLKANKEDLDTEHKHLQKSFDRLKSDHGEIDSAYKKKIQVMKEKNEQVISSLQRQVEYYQKQENSLLYQVKELKGTIGHYQTTLRDLMQKRESEKVSKNIEHGNNNAEQPASKNIKVLSDKGRFAILSEKPEERMDRIENVTHVDNIPLDSQKLLDHNIEKRNSEPKVELKQKPNDFNTDNNNLNEPIVRQDILKRRKRHKNNVARKEDIEEAYKRHDKWKNDAKKVDDTNFNGGQENVGENVVLVEDEDERSKMRLNDLNHANIKLNNDQKFDDHDVALQEGEENEDNAAEGEDRNEMVENEKLLEKILTRKK